MAGISERKIAESLYTIRITFSVSSEKTEPTKEVKRR